MDTLLLKREDLFLFPGNDQILICFRIEGENIDNLEFVVTDKLGKEKERYPLSSFDRLTSNYTANIENIFNFDITLGKQSQLYVSDMKNIWEQITR